MGSNFCIRHSPRPNLLLNQGHSAHINKTPSKHRYPSRHLWIGDLHLWKVIYICGLVSYICEYIWHDIDPINQSRRAVMTQKAVTVSTPPVYYRS